MFFLLLFSRFFVPLQNKGDGFASTACTTLDFDSPSRRRVVFLTGSLTIY